MKQGPRQLSNKRYKKVTHCIFDLDGTVLDSEIVYHEMIKTICKKYGKIYPRELQIRMHGRTDFDICRTVVRELELPISRDEFDRQTEEMATTMLPKAPLQK
ncbi:GS1-like, isoform B, partial [Operophtera brumata]